MVFYRLTHVLFSNVVAYTITAASPRPYRFKSTILPFQIPSIGLGQRLSDSNFIKNMSDTDTWKASLKLWHTIRTWTWRTILGDRVSPDARLHFLPSGSRKAIFLTSHFSYSYNLTDRLRFWYNLALQELPTP